MKEQVLAFLTKYQEMRKLKNEYAKNFNRHTLNKCLKLEMELDELPPKIKEALEL